MKHEIMLHVLRSPDGVPHDTLKDACWQAAELLITRPPVSDSPAPALSTIGQPAREIVERLRSSLDSLVNRLAATEQYAGMQEQAAGAMWQTLCRLMDQLDAPNVWTDVEGHLLSTNAAFVETREKMLAVIEAQAAAQS